MNKQKAIFDYCKAMCRDDQYNFISQFHSFGILLRFCDFCHEHCEWCCIHVNGIHKSLTFLWKMCIQTISLEINTY